MMRRVLDTSVVIKWFFEEEGSDRAEVFLKELELGTGQVVIPSLLFYEASNVLWLKRRQGLQEEKASAIWSELLRLPLEALDGMELVPQALALSFRQEVSPYDALFVVLARALGSDFITADHTLWTKIRASCPWVKKL